MIGSRRPSLLLAFVGVGSALSAQTPDAELGRRYFGEVTLGVVPSQETDAQPATEFFFQDQIGLRIEGLKDEVRLPFSLRGGGHHQICKGLGQGMRVGIKFALQKQDMIRRQRGQTGAAVHHRGWIQGSQGGGA